MNSRVEHVDRVDMGGDRYLERVEKPVELLEKVRQAAYGLHKYLGTGLLEKVYENGLKHRLQKIGVEVEAQKPLKVLDEDGFVLGDYFADLVVNDCLIIELKSVKALANEHLAQILNYLKITNNEWGLLINFGSYKFEARTVHNTNLHGLPVLHGQTESSSPLHGLPVLHG